MAASIRPLHDRVLIRSVDEEQQLRGCAAREVELTRRNYYE